MAHRAGFRNGSEQISGAMELISLRLSAAYLEDTAGGIDYHGSELRTADVERILAAQSPAAGQAVSAIRQLEAVFRRDTQLALNEGVLLPFETLCTAFSVTPVQRFLLMLAMAMEAKLELERVVAFLQHDLNARFPTLGLGLRLYAMNGQVEQSDIFGNREFFRLLFQSPSQDCKPVAFPLSLHPRVMEYLMDPKAAASSLQGIVTRWMPEQQPADIRFYGGIINDLEEMQRQSDGENLLLMLEGESGAGKRLLMRHLSRAMGKALLVVELEALGESRELLTDLERECRLYSAIVALRLSKPPSEETMHICRKVRDALARVAPVLWLLSEHAWTEASGLAEGGWAFIRRKLPDLSAMQRRDYWQSMPGMERFAADLDLLSNKYTFTPGMMDRAYGDACRIARWEEMKNRGGDEILSMACRQQLAHNMGSHATLIDSPFQWDDLVLPEDKKNQLYSICAQVRNHHTVFEQWGFSRRVPYGQGLSALFTGPPGTGKTMAAQVLAGFLGIEIYQVNLSAVVSKYIGETEKNLEVVFTEGSKSRCILFFDEADALFAKRTELKDANDRFANAESAYLLQRIENYQGIVILATNYAQNFDPAFRRRIKFTIEFPIPDEASRLLMWRKILAPPVPVDGSLDLELIAARFELTGSAIKNIAMNAAFFAAQEGVSIGQAQMQQALRIEYAKSGRVVEHTI